METLEYELIGGVKHKMSPTNFFHYSASDNLADKIKGALVAGYKVVQDVTLTPPDTAIKVFPDVAIFKTPIHFTKKGAIRDIPVFIAEVVSPSTRPKDFTEKKKVYETLGVKCYWIVDPYGKYIIEHYLATESHAYDNATVYQFIDDEETENKPLTLSVENAFSVSVDMEQLFTVDGELVD